MLAMWTFALARLAGILVLGLCLGLLIGPIWLWVLLAACLYLGWQLVTLYRIDRWLRLRSQIDPPDLSGVWGDIVALVKALAPYFPVPTNASLTDFIVYNGWASHSAERYLSTREAGQAVATALA